MSVSCELCREHLGEVLEAEIRQAASPLHTASLTLPTQPEIASANGAAANNLSIAKEDAELSDAEFAAISKHIADCAQCVSELRQMRAAHRTLRSLPLQSAPANLRERVRIQLETATKAETTTSAIAVAPVRSSAYDENLWQRTQRGWSNLWNRPRRTAWMGGSLAIGALGIFLLARLPEWSSTQTTREAVTDSNQSRTATENLAPENTAPGNTTITAVPNVVPKSKANSPQPRPSSAPEKSASDDRKPPAESPSPAFPNVPRTDAPDSFIAPPLPKLPPVTVIKPRMSAGANSPRNDRKTSAAKAPAATQKSTAPTASKATAAPTTNAPANDSPRARADATAAATQAPNPEAPKNVAPSKVASREVQRDVISLRVAPLNSSAKADSSQRVAAGPQGPRGGAPPSVGGFMSSSQGARSADNADSASEAAPSGDAPVTAGPPRQNRMARPNPPVAALAQAREQAREVSIEVTPPRDLSKARLLVTLAPDWQFSDAAQSSSEIKDATLQREIWQGKATSGQPLRVTLAIQPHFALADDANGGTLRAGRTPLMVELWDVSGPAQKLVASRRLELPAESDDKAGTAK